MRVGLVWDGELRFSTVTNGMALSIDGQSTSGPSPVQALVLALAGCMAVDVVDIVVKGRHALRAFSADLIAQRAPEPPSRVTAVTLHFRLEGAVPPHAVERAIALSREKYCSVWHSLRQDIPLETTFEVVA